MILRSERVVIPVSVEEKERIIAAAEAKGFQMATWARATLLGETTSERKEKATSGRKKSTESIWAGDVAYLLNRDSGSPCPGSGQLYPFSQFMGKYPGAICEFCRVEHVGQDAGPGLVQVREHLDGVQSDEEVGFIESLGKEVDDTRAIGEKEGF